MQLVQKFYSLIKTKSKMMLYLEDLQLSVDKRRVFESRKRVTVCQLNYKAKIDDFT